MCSGWVALGSGWVALCSGWVALGSGWVALGSGWVALGSGWVALCSGWVALGSGCTNLRPSAVIVQNRNRIVNAEANAERAFTHIATCAVSLAKSEKK